MKLMYNCTWTFLSKNDSQFLLSVFTLFWVENFLVGLGKKHLSSIIYFPFSSPNQTHSKKFSFLFSLQIFHPPYFTFKQTHPKVWEYLDFTTKSFKIWILPNEVWGCLDFTSWSFKIWILRGKIQILSKFWG